MNPVRLRQTLHRGSVLASGLAIDTRLIPEAIARRRILERSSTMLRVLRAEALLLATFRAPVRVDCSAATGAPLVRSGQLLSPAPLRPDEHQALELPVDALVLVEGGAARALPLSELVAEDISSWLDLSSFVILTDTHSLGEVLAEPEVVFIQPQADVRQALGGAPLTEGAEGVVQSLTQPQANETAFSFIWDFIDGLRFEFWRTLLAIDEFTRVQGASSAPSRALIRASGAGPSWFARVRRALSSWLARGLFWSRFTPFFRHRQAAYLARMLEMFDTHQLDEALLHAIPLSSRVGAALKPPPLTLPSARSSLEIVPGQAEASTTLGLGADLFDGLQRRYRSAFERLVDRGEIEKAAFVLAELLHANLEAVSFLEQHRRLRLAAEVAEARGLPPGVVIRLWFLVGERDRALRIARQTGAFEDAVLRLEQTHAEEARALRLVWADALASAGAYAAAVDAVWPVADARNLTLAWLERATSVGGIAGARMLARKALLMPESFLEVRDAARDLLQDPCVELPVRQAFGRELVKGEATPETRALAKLTARRLLQSAKHHEELNLVKRLIEVSGDAIFRADFRESALMSLEERPRLIQVRAFARAHLGRERIVDEAVSVASFLSAGSIAKEASGLEGDATSGVALAVFDGSRWDNTYAASRVAADAVVTWLRGDFPTWGGDVGQWARSLTSALKHANHQVFQVATVFQLEHSSACSATVATLCGDKLLLAQLGTTQAYVLRGLTLTYVTNHHSEVGDYIRKMDEAGTPLTQAQLDELPDSSSITRAVGMTEEVHVDTSLVMLERGDVILLSSSRLFALIGTEGIRTALLQAPHPQDACSALGSMALEAGASDALPILVARVDGEGLPPRSGAPVTHLSLTPPPRRDIQRPTPLTSSAEPIEIVRSAGDHGALSVLDAAELPDGRLLIALGELGVWLLARDGRVLMRFAEPADRLVLSDHGDRAILVAQRGEAHRVARLDLVTKRVRYWCDARFDRFADNFDGFTWLVARGDTLYSIEATSDRWEHHWKIEQPGATIMALQRDAKSACVCFGYPETNGELWTFELPSLTLRRRQWVESQNLYAYAAISADGKFVGCRSRHQQTPVTEVFMYGSWSELMVAASHFDLPYITRQWIVQSTLHEEGTQLHLFDTSACCERMRVTLGGPPGEVGLRFQGDHLTVHDSQGRVLIVSLYSGEVIREHRVS